MGAIRTATGLLVFIALLIGVIVVFGKMGIDLNNIIYYFKKFFNI